jgi:PIN domain
MVAFDNSIFCIAVHPDAKSRSGVDRGRERVEYLLERLNKEDERIIIPTPAFSEFLVLGKNEGPLYLAKIRDMSIFRLEPFDDRAAIELADIEIAIRAKGDKRGSVPEADWQKVKFDRQIVAIAKAHGARCIYSDDPHIERHGEDCGLKVIPLSELPLPPAVQVLLDFKEIKQLDESAQNQPEATDVRGSGGGHSEDQAPAENKTADQSEDSAEVATKETEARAAVAAIAEKGDDSAPGPPAVIPSPPAEDPGPKSERADQGVQSLNQPPVQES